MFQNLVLTYVVVAVLVMVGLAAYWTHRGRWSHTFNDHLAIVGVALAWPVLLPFAFGFFIVAIVSHVYSGITRPTVGPP